MTTVGIKSKAMEHTTRKPRERKIDFAHLDLKKIEELVGRPPQGVTQMGIWIVCDFGNCTVSFRQWKSV